MLRLASPILRGEIITTIEYRDQSFPVHACHLGSEKDNVPVLAFIGGVHGVERIGSQVVLAFLETLVQRLQWDDSLISGLENLRLLFIPVVNPVGMIRQTRANGAGVDLMRNAPVNASDKVPFLLGGQRISSFLPWYRGKPSNGMEPEASALCSTIQKELDRSAFTLLIDVHSGYGTRDRIWLPLAGTHKPIEALPEYFALYQLLEKTYPNLDYIFEPQSREYLTHGDIWDFLYLSHKQKSVFMPLTLEMGSWNWVKKNPRQMGSFFGFFNPVKPHRIQRVLRRHTILLEFLIRVARAYDNWLPEKTDRESIRGQAWTHWYQD